jgi:rubrerythrin
MTLTKPSSDSKRRQGNTVVSLNKFAHAKSKGTRRAIEKFRQKKKSKFNHNAGLLREYKKVMKNEGYEAGKGASRKRQDVDAHVKENATDVVTGKRKKADPFAKARQQAEKSKLEKIKREEAVKQRLKEKELKEKQNKLKARKMSQRTRKGQPIIKNVVEDLLEKIKNSVDK